MLRRWRNEPLERWCLQFSPWDGARKALRLSRVAAGRSRRPRIDRPALQRSGIRPRTRRTPDRRLTWTRSQLHVRCDDRDVVVASGAIIEIGAYRMEGRRIADSFQSLVRPRMPIPRFVTGLTSITNEMVREAPPIEEVLPAFRDFLSDAVMVAHNAQFDHSFLDFEFRRLFGIGLTNPVLCTIRIARRLLPSVKRRRLDFLAEHFGLSTEGRHRGLGDARMAAELLAIFIEIASRMGLNRLDRLLDWQHRGNAGRRIERHVPPEVIAALPQGAGVYLMRNERGDLLYVGKATRLRDRVASYFSSGVGINAK